jgi:hypothetical protein
VQREDGATEFRVPTAESTGDPAIGLADPVPGDKVVENMEATLMLNRLGKLRDARGEAQAPEDKAQLEEEIEMVEDWMESHDVVIPREDA